MKAPRIWKTEHDKGAVNLSLKNRSLLKVHKGMHTAAALIDAKQEELCALCSTHLPCDDKDSGQTPRDLTTGAQG